MQAVPARNVVKYLGRKQENSRKLYLKFKMISFSPLSKYNQDNVGHCDRKIAQSFQEPFCLLSLLKSNSLFYFLLHNATWLKEVLLLKEDVGLGFLMRPGLPVLRFQQSVSKKKKFTSQEPRKLQQKRVTQNKNGCVAEKNKDDWQATRVCLWVPRWKDLQEAQKLRPECLRSEMKPRTGGPDSRAAPGPSAPFSLIRAPTICGASPKGTFATMHRGAWIFFPAETITSLLSFDLDPLLCLIMSRILSSFHSPSPPFTCPDPENLLLA